MSDDNQIKEVIFLPGCFDGFEGTQEELDELVAMIRQMAESGELMEKARSLDLDDVPEDVREKFTASFDEDFDPEKAQEQYKKRLN